MQTRIKKFLALIVAATPESPTTIVFVAIAVISGLGIADYFTGYKIILSLLYFIPIVYVSWFSGFRYGALCSVIAAGMWISNDILLAPDFPLPIILWNAFSRLAIFVSASWLLDRLHQMSRSKLQEMEQKYVHIVETVVEGILTIDSRGVIRYANKKVAKMLHCIPELLVGKGILEFVREEESRARVETFIRNHQRSDGPLEVQFTKDDGLPLWVLIYPAPPLAANGAGEETVLLVVDISETKRSEEELRKQYNEITAIHQLSASLVLSLRLRWRLQAGLHSVLEVTGFDAGSIYLVREERREVVLEYAQGFSEVILPSINSHSLGKGITGIVAQEGVAQFVNGSAKGEKAVPFEILENLGGGFASIPLIAKKRVVGVLNITIKRPYVFTEYERSVLQTFGNQIGIAIENAQLYEAAREQALKIRQLSIDLARVQDEERKHFARELHDGLSQTLTTLKINAELSVQHLRDDLEKGRWFLEEVIELADEAQAEAKDIAYDLRPSVLDDFGLKAAISLLASKFQRRTGIVTELDLHVENIRFESLVESTVYRIVQELLANVAKHSKAKTVKIRITTEQGMMLMSIADDGKGIQPKPSQVQDPILGGRGLCNIRERLEVLGGAIRIESALGSGTQVGVEIPLETWSIDRQLARSS